MFLSALLFATTLQMTWVLSSRKQFNFSLYCHHCRHDMNAAIFVAFSIVFIAIVIKTTIFKITIGMITPTIILSPRCASICPLN